MSPLIDSRYRILELLGQGGTGTVYVVQDTFQQDRRLALKILNLDSDDLRFELLAREYYHLTRLIHPGLVKVYDFGVEHRTKRCYFTMELLVGDDLVQATRSLPLVKRAGLIAQACRVLGFVHDAGYLHNDIKPDNFLVSADQPEPKVRLLDFGLAYIQQPVQPQSATGGTLVSGTVPYLAPEVLAGQKPDIRSDLFSFGIVLHEVLTGQHPFEGPESSSRVSHDAWQRPTHPSMLNQELPPGIDELLESLLSPRPRERPASAHTILLRLNAAFGIELPLETQETSLSYVHSRLIVQREAALGTVETLLEQIAPPDDEAQTPSAQDPGQLTPAVGPKQLDRLQTAAPQTPPTELPAEEAPEMDSGPASPPSALLLCGDTGRGKTRILEELRIRAQLAGFLPLQFHSLHDGARQYGAVCQLLETLIRLQGPESELVEQLLEEHKPGVLRLLPELRPGQDEPRSLVLPAEHEQERLHEQLGGFLLGLVQQRPCLLLIDDLPRLDDRSLHFLHHLARGIWHRRQRGERLPFVLVATLPESLPPQHPATQAIGEWIDEPFCLAEKLPPLTAAGVHALIGSMFQLDKLPKSFTDWVFALSEGNPLFVEELLEFLLDEGHIRRVDPKWQILLSTPRELKIPESLSDIIADRLARLEPDELLLLQLLATFGRPIQDRYWRHLSELGEERHDAAVRKLLRRQLIVELRLGSRSFHELEQPARGAVLYRQMPESERQALHLRIAKHLESLNRRGGVANPEELAQHYVRGGDLLSACRHAWAAGDMLRQVHAGEKALEMYWVVLEAFQSVRIQLDWDDFPAFTDGSGKFPLQMDELVKVLKASYRLHHEMSQFPLAFQVSAVLLYVSERTGDERLAAQASRQIGSIYRLQGRYERAQECIHRALQLFQKLEDLRGVADCLHEVGFLQYQRGQYLPSLEYFQQSLGIRQSLGDRRGIIRSYNNIGIVHFYLGNYRQAVDYYERALEICRAIDDQYGVGKNLNNVGLIHYQLGDLEKAAVMLEESLRLKRESGERQGVATALSNLGEIHRILGNFHKSLEQEKEAYSIRQELGDQQGLSISANNLGVICTRLGQYEEALRHLSKALITTRKTKFRVLEAEVLCNLAETHLELGETGQAHTLAEQALRLANDGVSRPNQLTANLTLAHFYMELDRPEEAVGHVHLASQLATELSSKEKQTSADLLLAAYHRYGRRHGEALSVLENALRLATELKSRPLLAAAHLERARIHLDHAHPADAKVSLRTALSIATKLTCPELQWQLHYTAGQIEASLQQYANAFAAFRRCVEMFRRTAEAIRSTPLRETYLADRRRACVSESIRQLKAELRRMLQ